jgi:hypothetical protein
MRIIAYVPVHLVINSLIRHLVVRGFSLTNYLRNQVILEPIKPEWKDDHFEYGVCTHIDSNGKPTQDDGLCPTPLKCEARQDKYVCSCGRDRYLDEETNFCRKY